ncbi:hypothetical protein TeGR_g6758 [Tetraparma gracilis]|uniref:FYVE-type domain-containing protein n=1 Tax=Tetraparma gracilis TaxID=2962635 RepID=A0ABQ6MFL2_9STRA|nr:hypothetical protein TeGR_g6758 [Tetraparma gracilis]
MSTPPRSPKSSVPVASSSSAALHKVQQRYAEEDRALLSDLKQGMQSKMSMGDMIYDPKREKKQVADRKQQQQRAEARQAQQRSNKEALEREQQELQNMLLKKRQFQANLALLRSGRERRAVATGKILAKAHCLRAAQQGVAAAEAYWVALICGERTAAYDLHSLVSSGASGCAKHTFLAAVLFCVAVEASSLTDRESKEAAPLPDSALDARLKREPKEELVRRCKEVAQPPLRVATFACARVIHRAMQEGEHAFVTSKLGTSLALATQHLDETDLKISAALAPHAHLLPIQLGSYNLLDLLRIPETPPAWALSQRCSQCEEKFGLFVRRHHCRNCGVSVCGGHSSHRVTELLGGRWPAPSSPDSPASPASPASPTSRAGPLAGPLAGPSSPSSQGGKLRVCDSCYVAIMRYANSAFPTSVLDT